MADEKPSGPEEPGNPEEEKVRPHSARPSRRTSLTPEMRRFLNKPQTAPNEKSAEPERIADSPAPSPEPALPSEAEPISDPPLEREPSRERPRRTQAVTTVAPANTATRAIELQQAFLILGALLLLGLTFFVGMKYNYIKYLIFSRNAPAAEVGGPDLYPGVAPEDLIKQALQAEHESKWDDAIDRFMAAKRKDLHYRGIFFHVGKILYDHRNFEAADKSFERAIAFGENLEAASFYRGLIAVRNHDLTTAERFFEAAVTAAPFVSDYHYYWGETLRLDLKPTQALPHYERATLLARDEQDAAVCRFKIRMAQIEAAEAPAVSAELEKKKTGGALSVDWLMTDAALELRDGHIDAARELIVQARAGKAPGLFASCVNDFYFQEARKKFPELTEALHLDLDLQIPFPN